MTTLKSPRRVRCVACPDCKTMQRCRSLGLHKCPNCDLFYMGWEAESFLHEADIAATLPLAIRSKGIK